MPVSLGRFLWTSSARSVSYIPSLLATTAIGLASAPAYSQDNMDVSEPDVSVLAFTTNGSLSGTVVDGLEFTNFELPQITDSGSVVFSGNQQFYVAAPSGSISTITDFGGQPFFNGTIGTSDLNVDEVSGDVTFVDSFLQSYVKGNVSAPDEFDVDFSIDSQFLARDVRTLNGVTAIVDGGVISVRRNELLDFEDLVFGTTSNTGVSSVANDVRFAGENTLIGSFVFGLDGSRNEQAIGIYDLETDTFAINGPDFVNLDDQLFNGLRIPAGQFTTGSSLNPGSSNGDVIAFVVPVVENSAGNFAKALATQTVDRDPMTGEIIGISASKNVVFGIITSADAGVPLETNTTTIGNLVFLDGGPDLDPVVSENGDVIFFASARAPGTDAAATISGFWRLRDSDGIIEPVLVDGTSIDGITSFGTVGQATINFDEGGSFVQFDPQLTLNAEGQIAATVRVNIAGQDDPVVAIVGQNVQNEFFIVAHEGQTVDLGDDGGTRTIAISPSPNFFQNVNLVTGTLNQSEQVNSNELDGLGDGFNVNSQLAFLISFEDGTEAIVRADLGVLAAPDVTVFRWTGGCGSVEWGTACTIGGDEGSNWVNRDNPDQIAPDAPGENPGIQRAIIEGADVFISAAPVSITSIETINSTLNVSESLTVAEASNVDRLEVGGTVTSGNAPFTVKSLVLNGGTLEGAGGFTLTGEATDPGSLVTINTAGAGNDNTINTAVRVTGGVVRLQENASLFLGQDGLIEINEGATATLNDLRLTNGASISGSGRIELNGDTALSAAFSDSGNSTATLGVDLSLQDGPISVFNGTLQINGDVTFAPTEDILPSLVEISTGGRAIFTGNVSIQPVMGAGDAVMTIQPDPNFSLSRLVFDGTTVSAPNRQNLSIRASNAVSSTPFNGTRTDVEMLTSEVSIAGSTFDKVAPFITRSTALASVQFKEGGTFLNVPITLSGNNVFTSPTVGGGTSDRTQVAAGYLLQTGGETIFEGPGGTGFGNSGGLVIDVVSGSFIARGARTQFGTGLDITGGSASTVSLRVAPGATALLGGNADASRMTVGIGADRALELGEAGGNGTGAVRFNNVRFAALVSNQTFEGSRTITNNLSGNNLDSVGTFLTNAQVDTDFTLINNGDLVIDGLTGASSLTLQNAGRTVLNSSIEAPIRFENSENGTVLINNAVQTIAGGSVVNDGTIRLAANAILTFEGNLRGRNEAVFDIADNSSITAENQEFVRIRTSSIDADGNEVDLFELGGNWELGTGSIVSLGEGSNGARIDTILAGSSVVLGNDARLNNLGTQAQDLRAVFGQFETPANILVQQSLQVGGFGADDASLSTFNIIINGDLDHQRGTIRARGTGLVTVDDAVTTNGIFTAARLNAKSLTQGEAGTATFSNFIDIDGAISVAGTLNVEGSRNTDRSSILANALTVTSTGTITVADDIRVDGAFISTGTVRARTITADSIEIGSSSTTTVDNNLTSDGDVTVGGTITVISTNTFEKTLAGQNVRIRNNTDVSDFEVVEADERLTIGTGVTLRNAVDVEANFLDLASRMAVTGITGPPGTGDTFRIHPDGVLVGLSTPRTRTDAERFTFFGFELPSSQSNPATIAFQETIIEVGGRTEGDLYFLGNVTNRGSLFPGFSPGAVIVQGDYTQDATGVLELEIGGTEPTEYDFFAVSGTATFDPASTINITLIDPDPDDGIDEIFRPRTGDTFDILLADNVEVTGGGDIADIITVTNGDQAGDFMPTLMTVDGQFMLQLEALFGSRLLETAGLTAAQTSIAGALDGISEVGDNEALADFAVALDGLEDAQTGSALSQAGFSFASGLYDIGFAAVNASRGHIGRHIDARIWTPAGAPDAVAISPAPVRPAFPNNAGFAGGGVFEEASQAAEMVASIAANQSFAMAGAEQSRFGFIASGGYSFGSADPSLNQTGLDYSGGGGALGAEAALNDSMVVGLSASLTSLSGDTDNGLGEIDATHYGIAAHAVAEAGPLVFDAQIGFGWLDVDTQRQIAVGDVSALAQSDGDGSTFHARARISLPLTGGSDVNDVVFGPSLEINTSKVNLDGLSETGAGDVGLTLGGDTQWRTNVAIGFNAAAVLKLGDTVLTPRASAAYEIALDRSSDALTTAFVGAADTPFATPTDRIGKDRVKVLTAADLRLSRRISASVAYQGSFGSEIKEHSLLAQARFSF